MDPVDSDLGEIDLLTNVHVGLSTPTENGETYLVKGTYKYYHYGCDNVNDKVKYYILCFVHVFIKIYLLYLGLGLWISNSSNVMFMDTKYQR